MKGDSLRRQTAAAEAYARQHGLNLDTTMTFRDLGVSAFRGKNAATGELKTFLRAIEDGVITAGSYLLVENLDRMSRQGPWEALPLFQQIINEGVTIVTLQDGKVWSMTELKENPYRIMESIIVMIRANEESATKSRRLKAAWSNKRSSASKRVLTAKAPTWLRLVGEGHDRSFEVVQEKAEVVRRIFHLAMQGDGQNKIAKTLNLEKVPTLDGGRVWYRSNIAKLLNSESVVGVYVPHTIEVDDKGRKVRKATDKVAGYYPVIVDTEIFAQVKATSLDSKNPLRGRHANGAIIRNILGGLACCPVCEGTMTRVTKGSGPKGGKPYLVCVKAKQGGGCTYKTVKLDLIEDALVGSAGMIVGEAPANGNEGDLQNQLVGLSEALDRNAEELEGLVEAYVSSRSPAIQERLRKAEADRETLEAAHRELSERMESVQGPLLRKRLADLWEALGTKPLDIGKANLALRAMLSKVVVDYRSGTLDFEWKHGGWSGGPMYCWPDEQYISRRDALNGGA